jgi:hypothetical protein
MNALTKNLFTNEKLSHNLIGWIFQIYIHQSFILITLLLIFDCALSKRKSCYTPILNKLPDTFNEGNSKHIPFFTN